ncbi:unnamed protein product [Adineta steineri]|uniref:Peptidase C1A papain C-terminal domain-containing protein n=2 Tax=Adineta steineri TaxID=433720 RepID=A0A819PG06_9BILA|nr:unnamed protein product [Adineta steineri]
MSNRVYLSSQTTKRKCRLNGIKSSERMPKKDKLRKQFKNHIIYSHPQLPQRTDLRDHMTPVEDQSDIASCVANSFAGAYEYLLKKSTGYHTDVSRLFIYYNARIKDEESDDIDDSGCTVASAIESLEESGTCLESLWPYKMKRVNKCPNDDAYSAAESHRISDALQLNVDLYQMKSCLAQGFPFVFGLELYESFDKANKKGYVPMPKPEAKNRGSHGSHAMLAVGYSDCSKIFIVRNSWGSEWGVKGYCYIPYSYMSDPDFCWDPWAVRKLETNDMGNDHWDDDDDNEYEEEEDEDDDEDDEDDDEDDDDDDEDDDEEDDEDDEDEDDEDE